MSHHMYKIRSVDKDKIKIFAFIVKRPEDVYASVMVYKLFFITWKRLWLNDFMLEKDLGKWFYEKEFD